VKHAEKLAPVAAAVTAVSTLLCCLPLGLAAAVATASLASIVSSYQRWFVAASLLLLGVGLVQLRRAQRVCRTRPTSSIVVFVVSAVVVLLVVLFPQMLASLLADWTP
jgi:cadmium resistance protein CadD (predicted permease)